MRPLPGLQLMTHVTATQCRPNDELDINIHINQWVAILHVQYVYTKKAEKLRDHPGSQNSLPRCLVKSGNTGETGSASQAERIDPAHSIRRMRPAHDGKSDRSPSNYGSSVF
jgi:hypothetical protein